MAVLLKGTLRDVFGPKGTSRRRRVFPPPLICIVDTLSTGRQRRRQALGGRKGVGKCVILEALFAN